jgi:ActR/RegA family two-component response regulator
MTKPRVAILAQDLVWADRLARSTEAAGGEPSRAKTAPELDRALACADHAIVDLTARAYDPIVAIQRARARGARVLAVGPHDDVALRKRAFVAGADKVLAYRKLFEDGPETIRRWLAASEPAADATSPAAAGESTGVGAPTAAR